MKRLIIPALVGTVVMFAWTFLVNAIFWLEPRVSMNRVTDNDAVYQILRQNVPKPGGYIVDLGPNESGVNPTALPVYAIRYSGVGHESAGGLQLLELAIMFVAILIASWLLLTIGTRQTLTSYVRRASFFVGIGLVIALVGPCSDYGIGGYPLGSALLLAGKDLIGWTLVGVTVSRWVKPDAH